MVRKQLQLLSLFLLLSVGFLKAQPGTQWDSLEYSGFNDASSTFRTMHSYNGKLYVGVGDGASLAGIYTSTNGRYGSYTLDYSFDGAKSPNDIAVTAITNSPSGWVWAGTQNNALGAKLYYFSGAFWYAMSGPVFSNPATDYTSVSKMTVLNVGGQDSLFACFSSNTNGIEVWKMGTAISSGPWTLAFNYGGGSNLKALDLLYFAGNYILLLDNQSAFVSTDAVNWFASNDVGNGFGDNNNVVKAMEVYNGELYALCQNSVTGVQIWKTSDMVTWNPVMQDGFTNTIDLTQAVDLHAAYGKLWVTTIVYASSPINGAPNSGSGNNNTPVTMGGPIGPLVYSTSDGTTFVRESEKLLGNNGNSQQFRLHSFANKTLCYGWNSYVGGSIYSKCVPPVAAATASGNDSICLNDGAFFSGTGSQYADSMYWYRNGNPAATGSSYNMPTFAAMTHTVDLVVWNAGCTDTATLLQTVIDLPMFQGSAQFPANPCIGQNIELSVNFSSAMPPNNYYWIGTTDTLYNDTNNILLTGPLNYTIYAQDAFGCASANGFPWSYTTPPSYNLGGTVTYSGGPVQGATVFAIKIGASSAQYDTVANTLTDAAGVYNFSSLNAGNYLLRVEPDTTGASLYDNCLNTYFGGTYLWDSATVYQHYCDSNITQAHIQLIEITPQSGPGVISGFVYEGVGFGLKLAQGPGAPSIMANVIPGVPVKVGKNPGGSIAASGTTDASGQYYFDNLPLDSYKIYTDIPGYPMDSSYAIVLSAGNDSLVDLNYFVDSNSVYIDLTAGAHNPANAAEQFSSINIYPNPSNGQISFNIRTETDAKADVKVFDVTGRLVYTENFGTLKSGMTKLSADLSALSGAKGIYFVVLRAGEKQYKGKVVIE